MSEAAREYELILILDPEVPEAERDKLAEIASSRIEKLGEMRHADKWGMRKLAYEIAKRTEADYRFYRFTGGNDLLDELAHNLKIADGILRFRVFKVDPRSPVLGAPEIWTAPKRSRDDEGRGGRGSRRDEDDYGSDDYESRDPVPASAAATDESA